MQLLCLERTNDRLAGGQGRYSFMAGLTSKHHLKRQVVLVRRVPSAMGEGDAYSKGNACLERDQQVHQAGELGRRTMPKKGANLGANSEESAMFAWLMSLREMRDAAQ